MEQRLNFESVPHTDYVFSVVVEDWRPILLVLMALVAGLAWWVRRRRRRTE